MSNKHASRPFVLLALLCAAVVAAVIAGVTPPLSASQFANSGHWVYNSALGLVFHVDGATANIDAELPLDAEAGSQVLQSDSSGYVVGQNRITEFDKASLEETESRPAPSDEVPLGIEVVGGPYAVYREAGEIVRLGDPAASIPTGGPIGDPVVTDDGTMWFHRTGNGQICRVELDAVEVSECPVSAPKDHPGALTVVNGRAAFLNLFTNRLHVIDGDSLGEGVDLGVTLTPGARPAAQDTNGRLAILDQDNLVLVDTRSTPVKSNRVRLGSSDFDGPVSTGDVIAVVDRQKGVLLTFGPDGKRKDDEPIKDKDGDPRLSQGEDKRIYVEDQDGTQVLVVSDDGDVTDVDLTARPTTPVDKPDGKPIEGRGPSTDTGGGPSGPPSNPGPSGPSTPTPPPPVPPSRPGAPVGVVAQPANGSANVRWGPAPNNRAPITSYVVSWRGSNGQTGSVTVGGGAVNARTTGLANGVRYQVSVAARNRVGTGPAASATVTPRAPVSRAAPPVNLAANYDEDDRPTRDVTLSWRQPALGGGQLVHYDVAATGQSTQQVTGTQVVYPDVQASQVITFTVRAVTRTPDGRTLIGRPATTRHENTVPDPAVSISQGGPSDTANCNPPDCAWVNATMSGFDPNTTYDITLSSNANPNVRTESFTTDGSGAATYNELNYDVAGETVWVTVAGEPSNQITWQPGQRQQPRINLSKGPPTQDTCGEQPDCAWMRVEMIGFLPNTEYFVMPHNDANDGYTNPGYTTTTDANGNSTFDRFAYTGPGETVWVTTEDPDFGTIESNHQPW